MPHPGADGGPDGLEIRPLRAAEASGAGGLIGPGAAISGPCETREREDEPGEPGRSRNQLRPRTPCVGSSSGASYGCDAVMRSSTAPPGGSWIGRRARRPTVPAADASIRKGRRGWFSASSRGRPRRSRSNLARRPISASRLERAVRRPPPDGSAADPPSSGLPRLGTPEPPTVAVGCFGWAVWMPCGFRPTGWGRLPSSAVVRKDRPDVATAGLERFLVGCIA